MAWIDDVLTEFQKADNVDAETLLAVSDFVDQNRALIDAASKDTLQAFVSALGRGDNQAAWQALTANLSPADLLALLRGETADMAELTTARKQALADFQAAIQDAGRVAIQLLAKAAFSLL